MVDQTGSPYSYAAGNPINGADPDGLAAAFNRQAELAYVARFDGSAYGLNSTAGYNKKYEPAYGAKPGSGLNDCTDFVSQALHAGGWAENNVSAYHAVQYVSEIMPPAVATIGGPTTAWENVAQFIEYAVASGQYAVASGRASVVPVSQAQEGDIVIADWNGTAGDSSFSPDHLMIITGFRGTDPLVAGHSDNRADLPLYGSQSTLSVEGIELRQGDHPTFEALHIST